MAITTMRTFVDNLEAVSITGVSRQYESGPPQSVNDPDLPASYVRLPSSTEGSAVFQNQGLWPELRATLVVVVKATAQGIYGEGFDEAVDMFGNVNDAMRNLSCGTLGKSHITWTIRQGIDTIAGTDYWALFVDVTGNG